MSKEENAVKARCRGYVGRKATEGKKKGKRIKGEGRENEKRGTTDKGNATPS